MKTILISLVWVLSFFNIFAQFVSPKYIVENSQKKKVDIYQLPTSDDNYEIFLVKTDFAQDTLSPVPLQLKDKVWNITKVDYVFSSYKLLDTFNQKYLDFRRLRNLKDKLPQLFEISELQWNFYEQTSAKTRSQAENLFHGFVFYVKKINRTEEMKKREEEIKLVDEILEDMTIEPDTFVILKTKMVVKYQPVLWFKRGKITYKEKSIWNRKKIVKIDTIQNDTIIKTYDQPDLTVVDDKQFQSALDKTIKDEDISNVVFVVDATGSMGSEIAKVLYWLNQFLKQQKTITVVFFNDGDENPDGPIGSSGGYHSVTSNDMKKITKVLNYTMSLGCGGAGPENDIEALLYAQKRFPNAEKIILIADNGASVRDMVLLPKLNKQVDVILTKVYSDDINPQYLKLIYHTGGQLIIPGGAKISLKNLKDGDIIKVGNAKFKFEKGDFYLL